MTLVRTRLLVALPVLALGLSVFPSAAPAVVDVECNGQVDVALGTPKADVDGKANAGSLTLLFEPSGSSLGNAADVTIDESDLGGTAGAGNRFGAAVTWGFDDTLSSGESGCSVVAVGAPGAQAGAGRVYVFLVDKDGVIAESIHVLTQGSSIGGSAEAGDGFGSSVFFGGDLFVRWLAIGVPYEDIGTKKNAGMVHVLKVGAWSSGAKVYYQGRGPVPGKAESGDRFGMALGPGRNAYSLWVGAPGEDVGKVKNAGMVTDLPGTASKLPGTAGGAKSITQDTKGVPDHVEKGDQFGEVLSGYVSASAAGRVPVVGVPHENIGKHKDAGIIEAAYPDKSWGAFQQGTKGPKGSSGRVDGKPEKGDRFGASLSAFDVVLLIGAPGEGVGAANGAGVIHRMTASSVNFKLSGSREQSLSQKTKGVKGTVATNDHFGTSVAFSVSGAVVGIPGKDTHGVTDAGAVAFFPFKSGAPTMGLSTGKDLVFSAESPVMGSVIQVGAGFGSVAYSVSG